MFRPIVAIFRLLQFCSKSIIYMPILRGDAEISSSLRVTISLHPTSHWPLDFTLNKLILTCNDDEISASPRNIGIYMILFQQNCNNLKMAAIGRNMKLFLLLNTIINPYYHSCGFVTDTYFTIRNTMFWGVIPRSLVAIKASQELAASIFRVQELSTCRPQHTGSWFPWNVSEYLQDCMASH